MAPIRSRQQRRPSAVQVNRRRSSVASLALFKSVALTSTSSSPRGLTFAPNVTPSNFTEEGDEWEEFDETAVEAMTFPPSDPSDGPRKPSARRKKSEGHIPRPPNAFMLFRADFVKQKHVPGSIETTHSTLSKIIGTCWRALALEEKRVWETRAKQAKAEHKQKYPNYRFRPVHTKGRKKPERAQVSAEEERRVDEVAHLLLEGKKGAELTAAVRQLDRATPAAAAAAPSMQHPQYAPQPVASYGQGFRAHRRSSSLPPIFGGLGPITVPTLPSFFPPPSSASRAPSPVHNIARAALGHRRASSAQALPTQSWLTPEPFAGYSSDPREESPLPEADHSMFNSDFLQGNGFQPTPSFSFNPSFNFSPIESIAPNELAPSHAHHVRTTSAPMSFDPMSYYAQPVAPSAHPSGGPSSQPSTAYSGSPAPSELALPVYAPRPTHAMSPTTTMTTPDFGAFSFGAPVSHQQQHQEPVAFGAYAFESAAAATGCAQTYYAPQHHEQQQQLHHEQAFYPQQQNDGGFVFPPTQVEGSFDVSQFMHVQDV